VAADLDTLLTALYVLIDDHVIASGQRRPRLVLKFLGPSSLAIWRGGVPLMVEKRAGAGS
jgi:hypothetical protein